MKKITTIAALLGLSMLAGQAFASDCEAKAADKKLAGAAKNSHIKKCMADGAPAAPKS